MAMMPSTLDDNARPVMQAMMPVLPPTAIMPFAI